MINGNMGPTALKDDAPQVVQVIYTETTYGKGEYPDPVRRVKQVYTLDGVLIAEWDPYGTLTVNDVMNVMKHNKEGGKPLAEALMDCMVNKMR